jgi:cytochrome c biogenesis protein CcmG/thiol:disulfide interchange protein DsbE
VRTPSGHRRAWLAAVVLVIAGVVATAVPAGAAPKKVEIAPKVTVTGNKLPPLTDLTGDAARGKAAPKLSGVNFNGSKTAFTPGGKPKVLVFLAHWCPHCQAEVPRIVQVASSGGTEGVDVTAVATATSKTRDNYPPSKWFKREKWPFPVLVDTADSTAAQAYGLSAYPFLVFVAPDGTVAARVSGELAPAQLRNVFQAFAAGRALNFSSS